MGQACAPDRYGTYLSAGLMYMGAAVVIAAVCDASQYLVITLRNKLLYSQYIHSPQREEKPVLTKSAFEGPLKIQSQSSTLVIAYFVLLCYF